MSDEGRGTLGKASLELTADTASFAKNVEEAHGLSDDLTKALEAIAAAGEFAERGLGKVKLGSGQAAESSSSAEAILRGVKGISEESRTAAVELDRVRLTDRQAAESVLAGDVIDRKLKSIRDNAAESSAALDGVALSGEAAAAAAGGSHMAVGGTSLPLMGGAIGAGALLAPAAGPAVLGLIAALPTAVAGAGGALGTLMLAFHGVGKAIEGNEKAYEALQPAQQQFVLTVRSLDGLLQHLEQTAGRAMFPGLTEALHGALSPGTVGMVTTAVTEFGHAIGLAGEQWGRYFGSPEFQSLMGPLLQEGAHSLDTLSTVSLHLVDALLQLGRAGIPLVNWLGTASVDGAKWLDTLVRSRDATGQLGSAMREAEVSLTLVGRLVESLGSALFALGAALYPVSKVAVKDLTDGLNWLAHVIDDNKKVIDEIVGTALNLLVDAVEAAVKGIGLLTEGLSHIVGAAAPLDTALGLIAAAVVVAFGAKALNLVNGWKRAILNAGRQAALSAGAIETTARDGSVAYVTATGEMDIATLGLAATIKGALISTGIGAIAVAVGIGAQLVIEHWSTVKRWIGDFGDWLSSHAYALLALPVIGQVAFMAVEVVKHWQDVKTFVEAFAGDIAEMFTHPVAAIENLFKLLTSAITSMFDSALNGIVDALDHVINAYNKVAGWLTGNIPAISRSGGAAAGSGSGGGSGPGQHGHSPGYIGDGKTINPSAAAGFGSGPGSAGKQKLLDLAKRLIGTPYAWGGNSPGGFDCSGLVQYALANGLNINLPHYSGSQVTHGRQVSESQAKVGDVVFGEYDSKGVPQHEGLIVGFTKSGQPIIEAAPHTGTSVRTYTGFESPFGGGRVTVRDMTQQPLTTSANVNPFGPLPPWTSTSTRHPAYKVPVSLTDEIAKRWATYKNDTTKQNLASYLAAVDGAEKLAEKHGISVATYVADISKAKALMQRKIAAAQVAAAKQTISQLGEQTAGPAQTLKLAQAANASPQIVLAAEQALLAAYQTEAASLKEKLDASSGKAKAAYKAALQKVSSAITSTEDSVVSTLQGIVQTAQQDESTYAGRVQQDVISQFDQQTQDYIDTVLGPEFFQGTDSAGAALQTPAEAQLAAMQAQDTATGLEQTLATDQASGATPAQLAQDQRAIDENNLSIQATKERQQADASYAASVKQYQAERAPIEAQLTDRLTAWAAGLTTGTSNLDDLNGIAAQFGVTLDGLADPTTGIGYDFSLLSDSASTAARALAELAAVASGYGGATNTTYAQAAAAGSLPGILAALHGGAVPMAAGGVGRVTMPTLFLAGEHGAEDFAFSGGGRGFGRLASTSTPVGDIVLVADSRELARANAAGLSRDRHAVHITAKAVKPAIGRVTSIDA